MKPEQFIREYGVEKARKVVKGAPDWATHFDLTHKDHYQVEDGEECCLEDLDTVDLSDLKRLVESLDLVEKLGGYGKCKFYMTGMKLNKCDSVKCPKTGLIVSRAALEIAINDYRESIYGGGDES